MTSATGHIVVGIFREIAFLPQEAPIDLDGVVVNIAEWDSIRQIQLVVRLEKRFNISLTEPELRGRRTLGSLIDLVEGKLDG